jgi:hypothetical protein
MQGPVLRDIHLPPEPGWWPPAPGWWVLAAVLVLALAWLGMALRSRLARRRRARRIAGLAAQAAARLAGEQSGAALAAELSVLLRRAARLAEPGAAALQGEAWLHWLDGGDPQAPFSRGRGRLLLDAPWRPALPRSEVESLVPLVATSLQRMAARGHG